MLFVSILILTKWNRVILVSIAPQSFKSVRAGGPRVNNGPCTAQYIIIHMTMEEGAGVISIFILIRDY